MATDTSLGVSAAATALLARVLATTSIGLVGGRVDGAALAVSIDEWGKACSAGSSGRVDAPLVKMVQDLMVLGVSPADAADVLLRFYERAADAVRSGPERQSARAMARLDRRKRWFEEMDRMAEQPGFCYLRVFVPGSRRRVAAALGSDPKLRAVLEALTSSNYMVDVANTVGVYRLYSDVPGDMVVRYHVGYESSGTYCGSFSQVVSTYARLYPFVKIAVPVSECEDVPLLPSVGTVGGLTPVTYTSSDLLQRVSAGYGASFVFPHSTEVVGRVTHGPYDRSLTVVMVQGQAAVQASGYCVTVDGCVLFGIRPGIPLDIRVLSGGAIVTEVPVPGQDSWSWLQYFGLVDKATHEVVDPLYSGLVVRSSPVFPLRPFHCGTRALVDQVGLVAVDDGCGVVEVVTGDGLMAMSNDWSCSLSKKVVFVGTPGKVAVKCVAVQSDSYLETSRYRLPRAAATTFSTLASSSRVESSLDGSQVVEFDKGASGVHVADDGCLDLHFVGSDHHVPPVPEWYDIVPMASLAKAVDPLSVSNGLGFTHQVYVAPLVGAVAPLSGHVLATTPREFSWWALSVPGNSTVSFHGVIMRQVTERAIFLVPPSVTLGLDNPNYVAVALDASVAQAWVKSFDLGGLMTPDDLGVVSSAVAFVRYSARGVFSRDTARLMATIPSTHSLSLLRLMAMSVASYEVAVSSDRCFVIS